MMSSPRHTPLSMPSHVMKSPMPLPAFPLSPAASSIHRSSLSSIDEVVEATPTAEDQPYRIAHPELLPDPQSQRAYASYCMADFIMHRTLGTGSFGRVHLGTSISHLLRNFKSNSKPSEPVRSKHNARFYAIKVLAKEKVVRTKQVEHTKSERAMLDAVHHPFIVNLWGTFQDSTNLYMVMDFIAGGELFSLLRKSKVTPLFASCHA
jgi:protein kinase A